MMRWLWMALGFVSIGLGILGAALPLLPTTPFLLLAAFAFARSSPVWHDWLVGHPRLGPPILNWQREGAIGLRAKVIAVAAMIASLGVSAMLGADQTILMVQAVVLTLSALFVVSRPSPSKQ